LCPIMSLSTVRPPPISTLFPYTTLFRSQSYVVFIVRDNRPADILFQCSDNTWQAYNRWPDRFSLYDDGSEKEWTSKNGIDVSFRSEEHTSELQSRENLVCRLLLEKKKII